jgi:signal transduction histidine kinase/CheY-like chemotaxis protein
VVSALSVLCIDALCEPRDNVLLLNSYHQGYPWTDELVGAVRETLRNSPINIELHVEYLDTKRQVGREHLVKMHQSLAMRYPRNFFQVIIVSDDNAYRFMLRRRESLFPGTPVVFCGVNDYDPDDLQDVDSVTGVVQVCDIGDTARLALRLHQGTLRLVIIHDDTPTGRAYRKSAERQLPQVLADHPQVRVLYYSGHFLTTQDLLARAQYFSSDTVAILTRWARGSDGEYVADEDLVPRLATVSRAPLWGVVGVGNGIIGGKIASSARQGHEACRMAVRILQGTSVDDLPVRMNSVNEFKFDYDELARWDIPLGALPRDSIIVNRPTDMWERMGPYIWLVVTLTVLQTVIILLLVGTTLRRYRAEKRLRASRDRLSMVVEGAKLGVYDWNSREGLFTHGAVFRDFLGTDGDHTVVPDWQALRARLHAGDSERVSGLVGDCLEGRSLELDTEFRVRRENGEWCWLYTRGLVAQRTIDGAPVRLLGMVQDISERKRQALARLAFERKVQQSQKLQSLGLLAGGVAHDFNNLLTTILGNTEMLLMELPEDSRLRPAVEDMLTVGEEAATFAGQLLAYSGKGQFMIKTVSVNRLLEKMERLLRSVAAGRTEVVFEPSDSVPMIEGDIAQIQQVVVNLVGNAADAVPPQGGTVTVSTGARLFARNELERAQVGSDLVEDRYVWVKVKDNGKGISREHIGRIFDPFYSTKFTGRGLGLAAVQGIVLGHGGAIFVDSDAGKGACFTVLFPATTESEDQSISFNEPKEPAERWEGGGTLLLADDEESVRKVAGRMLEVLGFEVLYARDGQEAVDVFRANRDQIRCVLLDLTMPVLDGHGSYKAIRKLAPDIPIIIASGYNAQHADAKFPDSDPIHFVQKPFRFDELGRAIRTCLDPQ